MIENKNGEAPKVNLNLSAVSNEEQSAIKPTTKIDYNTTKAPKQTSVNLNRIFPPSSSKQTNKTSAKSNGVLSEEQKALITKANTARQAQDNIMVGDIKAKITNNVALETKASYYESLAKYKDKRVTLTPTMKDTLKSAGKESVNAVRNAFASQDDVGSQTVGGIITATVMTTKALSTTKRATSAVESFVKKSPQTVKNVKEKIVKVGNKAYQIYGTADKMYLTIKQSLPLLKGGFVPMKNELITNALKNGLHKTANIQRIIKLTKKIKKTYQTIKKTAKTIKKACKYTINVIKVVSIDLKLKGGLTREVLKNAKDKAKPLIFKAKVQGLKVVNAVSKKTAKTAVKGGAFAVKRAIPKGIKVTGSVINNVSSIMSSSDNEMIRGVGYSATTIKYTVKTTATATKYTAKFVKTAPTKINNGVNKVKTATKKTVSTAKTTVKSVGNGIKFARKNGIKQAMKKSASKAKEKAAKASYNAGKSAVNMIINVAKKAMGKMLIPLIIAGALIGVIGGAAGAGGAVAGYYLSGEFIVEGIKKTGEAIGDFFENLGETIVGFFTGDEDEETEQMVMDIEEYLLENVNGIGHHRDLYIQKLSEELSAYLRENDGQYDKLTLILDNGTQINITETSEIEGVLNDNFWESEELYEKIRPLFYVRILVEYDLNTTVAQADAVLEEVFNSIISHGGFEGQTDFCGIICPCGIIHADVDCPHSVDIIHTEYTCDKCCVSECVGHVTKTKVCPFSLIPVLRHTCDSECVLTEISQTKYCEDKSCGFSCSGTKKCEGHYSWCATLVMERNIERFIDEYIDKPIADLEAKGSERTPEENSRLSTLKDYKDIAEEFVKSSSR